MKFTKSTITNILFVAFLLFLFLTPWGKFTRAKLAQGIAYIKTFVFSPKAEVSDKRLLIANTNFPLQGIVNAGDVNLNALEGKVVFMNYWATWCPPCRAEMPMINDLYKDYEDKVVFLFVTSDDAQKVKGYYEAKGYDFPTYNALANPPSEIDTRSIPATFIIDKKGKVAYQAHGASNWNSSSTRKLLDTLLSE